MASWHGDEDRKKQLVRSLDFEGNILAYCAKLGLKELQGKVRAAVLANECRMPSVKVNNVIGYQLARRIDKFYREFAVANHFDMKKLVFMVDNDEMINFLKNGHTAALKYGKVVDAHSLADSIANANYHGWPVSPRIKELGSSFEVEFHESVLEDLKVK
jgi:hypothetical protein